MRLARSVVALAIVLATTTSYMTRTSYAEDTATAEAATVTAVTTSDTISTTNTTSKPALGKFTKSLKSAADDFIHPPAPKVTAPAVTTAAAVSVPRGNTAGNTYTAGTCTWYVKSRIPSLTNHLGNAYEWLSRAPSFGYSTGTKPAAGAIAVESNHVAYIESVSSDKKTVVVSEMNYYGHPGVYTHTSPASRFYAYIYV